MIPAQVAGVANIAVASPRVVTEIFGTASLLGVSNVFQMGGAQAIAAFAYGTKTVPRADRIVGPGNIYVAAAKKLLAGEVGIDFIAGPTEILIIASDGNPARATLYSLGIAVVLLVTTVLPAEYGIDWTGTGQVIGLTAMGERKVAAAKSIGEANAATPAPVITATAAPTDQFSTISTLPLRHDEIEVKLTPKGQVEYKTILPEGEFIVFTWDAGGANLKFDFHGEPAAGPQGAFLSFHKGTASQSGGSLKAPFTGTHGWYWKNPTDQNVVIKLRVSGFYSEIKRM